MATFTPKELEISNKSYTNKDFEAIYLETLELAEKISKRFSPVNANEADPFIVLLKLVSAVTDKINYNVDKNILERFLLSCTQEKSMRDLTSTLGYNMRYYRSAETSVIFKYDFTGDENEPDVIDIPAFSIITNANNIQYITTENTKITRDQGSSPAINVIQGKLKDLEILGNKVIQLQNLNANNRLYLPEVMIAENGISINNSSYVDAWQPWKSSENLNTEVYGSLVYKFGFDSVKNLPYIDFPEWIADIIGDGLSIKYLITDGSSGNVAARELTTVIRTSSNDEIKDEDIIVINYSSASSGADPETIDEAYRGFKRIIGTFDTLVTCRDYANAIYNLLNEYGNPYVSNVQVGDRRNDINYSCNVISASDIGTQTKTIISYKYDEKLSSDVYATKSFSSTDLNKIFYVYDIDKYYVCKKVIDGDSEKFVGIELTEDELQTQISPYDLCIYGLKPISNTSYVAADDINGYNKSYTLLKNSGDLKNIQLNLEPLKTISHIYKEIQPYDIGYIQNNYYLNATITTAKKVNILEQNEILININNALIAKYNPRTLLFGYEIAFDELLATIENADPRIKSVSLQEPEQESKIILGNNNEVSLFDNNGAATDKLKFIIAKNALAGRIELFEYDKDFNYSFYQKNAYKVLNVVKAETHCNLDTMKGNYVTSYVLNENEAIQFLAPKLHTKVTYPYGINYYLELADVETDKLDENGNKIKEKPKYIPANSEYMLKANDKVIFTYLDNNDNTIIDVYDKEGQIIKPNFNVPTTAARLADFQTPTLKGVSNNLYNYQNYSFFTLTTNQTIEYEELVFDHLNIYRKCYWLTNQPNNQILWKKVIEKDGISIFTYVLGDGEHFYYSDTNLTSLYAFGSGTRLKLYTSNENNADPKNWSHNNYISVDAIDNDGLEALGDVFIGKTFSEVANNYFYLDIFENEIITITSGDTLEVTNATTTDFEILDNTFTALPKNVQVKYKFQGNDELFNALPDRSTLVGQAAGWEVRALLDLNVGPNKPQILLGNQSIIFYPGMYDELSKRFVSYLDIICDANNNATDEDKASRKVELTKGSIFETTAPITAGGSDNINLQFINLDLTYKCPSLLIFENDSECAVKLQKINDEFYSTSFAINPTVDKTNDTTYEAISDCVINVSPVDCYNIATQTIDSNQEANINYLNGKVYYNSDDSKYYQLTRNCVVENSSNADINTHNPLDKNTHTYEWKEVQNVQPSSRMFMIHASNLDANKCLTVKSDVNTIRNYNSIEDEESTPTISSTSVIGSPDIILWNSKNVPTDGTWQNGKNIDEADISLTPKEGINGFKVIALQGMASADTNHQTDEIKTYDNIPLDSMIKINAKDKTISNFIKINVPAKAEGKIIIYAGPFTKTEEGESLSLQLRKYHDDNISGTYEDEGSHTENEPRDNFGVTGINYMPRNFEFTIKNDTNDNQIYYLANKGNSYNYYITQIIWRPDNSYEKLSLWDIDKANDELWNIDKKDENAYKKTWYDTTDTEYFSKKIFTLANSNGFIIKTVLDADLSADPKPGGVLGKFIKIKGKEKLDGKTSNAITISIPSGYKTNVIISAAPHQYKENQCIGLALNKEKTNGGVQRYSAKDIMVGDSGDGGTYDFIFPVDTTEATEDTIYYLTIDGDQSVYIEEIAVSIVNISTTSYIINLHNGINIIEVADNIEGTNTQLCNQLTLEAAVKNATSEEDACSQLATISTLISNVKVSKGLNPMLGIHESDDIVGYIKNNFTEQFKEFFICADLDPARQIEISKDYPLTSAYAFYDSNNIANKWTLCKIDFTKSDIKIAKSSKYN